MAAKWLRWLRDGMAEGNLKPNFHHVYVTILSQLEGIFHISWIWNAVGRLQGWDFRIQRL